MNKFGFATIIGSGLAAAVLSLAAPAQADVAHNIWANDRNGSGSAAPVRRSLMSTPAFTTDRSK
jgi:hypothetical protein